MDVGILLNHVNCLCTCVIGVCSLVLYFQTCLSHKGLVGNWLPIKLPILPTRPYFQAHTIQVLTKYPLKKVMRKLDLSRRLANWAMELREFDIEFLPWSAIKGQALGGFPCRIHRSTRKRRLAKE
jgi:hypothetical protein